MAQKGFGARPPERQTNRDEDLFRSFRFGCVVVFIGFLVGWAVIALFWLNS